MNSIRPVSMSDNTNFTSRYNFSILRKNNMHRPFLNNEINALRADNKGMTVLFETKPDGEIIHIGADLKNQLDALFTWMREAGIKREKNIISKAK